MLSAVQSIMKLESLPNEILIECLKYLQAFDIFQAFNQLNTRIDYLICKTRLHIDFHHVKKSVFDQFLCKLSSNPELINQISSIRVSTKDQCFQCNLLFSSFALDQYPNLQRFEITLPCTNLLWYWENAQLSKYLNIEQADLLFSKLHSLSIICLSQSSMLTGKISSIIRLSTLYCDVEHFYYLIKFLPRLKYLEIKHQLVFSFYQIGKFCHDQCAMNLKELIVGDFRGEMKCFKILVKETPNLRHLIISASDNVDIIDAQQWQDLITYSLPHLNQFQFRFQYRLPRNCFGTAVEKFQQFQTDFWQEQHHWYTEYAHETEFASIYTIPYPSLTYELKENNIRYSKSNINTFIHVTDLNLHIEGLTRNCQYYFPNITSLTFRRYGWKIKLTSEHVDCMKSIVNLSNLKHLSISQVTFEESSLLLELFQEASQLSSITLDSSSLESCLKNEDLCQYLKKMITKLHQTEEAIVRYHANTNRFCEIFSNLEHIQCYVAQENDLLFLLNYLPKLSTIKAICQSNNDPKIEFSRLALEARRLKFIYYWKDQHIIHSYMFGLDTTYVQNKLFIWMNI